GAAVLFVFVQPLVGWAESYRPGGGREPRFLAEAFPEYQLTDLWAAISAAPPGRVLAVSSQFRFRRHGTEVWPTYLFALVPVFTGRELVGGTYAHWTPVATAYWTGRADAPVLDNRTDLLDDQAIFGLNWRAMGDARFAEVVRRLGVGVILATEYDLYARTYLDRSPLFRTVKSTPYWVVYGANTPPSAPVTSAPSDLRPRATWVGP